MTKKTSLNVCWTVSQPIARRFSKLVLWFIARNRFKAGVLDLRNMKTLTVKDIDDHFESVKEVCKILLPCSERSRKRTLAYFLDLIDEQGDMEKEYAALLKIADALGIPLPDRT